MKTNLKSAWSAFMSLFNKSDKQTTQISTMNIFVSNLNYKVTQTQLNDLFAAEGRVQKCHLVLDKATQKSKGFGFIEMEESEGMEAINNLNEKDFMGRKISVKVALPKD